MGIGSRKLSIREGRRSYARVSVGWIVGVLVTPQQDGRQA
jgi:hypothetical protein